MIIPPDPEKDPRLFAESRVSLVSTEADLVSLAPTLPEVAYHRDYLYSGSPFSDDYTDYPNEALPPYEGRRAQTPRPRRSARNSDILVRIDSTSTGSSSSNSLGSTSSRANLRARGSAGNTIGESLSPTSTAVDTNNRTSKLWEGSAGKKRRWVSPEVVSYFQKHRRWIVWVIVCVIAAILIAIGLAVGLGMALHVKNGPANQKPWKDKEWPGSSHSVQIGTLNITYVPRRDDPTAVDGIPSLCNQFAPLNTSSPLSQLALTSTFFDHYVTSFEIPITNSSTNTSVINDPLYFIAHGLASSGTLEIVGTDSPPDIRDGGKEGYVQVDVIARSPKDRSIDHLAKVCMLKRSDGSQGVGIFTPVETDSPGAGSVSPYLLNPLQTPAFHVIIRLPPSAMKAKVNNVVHMSNVTFTLSGMSVRVGNLFNVATFGDLVFAADCRGGGMVANYLAADTVLVAGAEGSVQGTFNVTKALNVNSTSGTIFANVILHNPDNLNDSSTTVESSVPMPRKRAWKELDTDPHWPADDTPHAPPGPDSDDPPPHPESTDTMSVHSWTDTATATVAHTATSSDLPSSTSTSPTYSPESSSSSDSWDDSGSYDSSDNSSGQDPSPSYGAGGVAYNSSSTSNNTNATALAAAAQAAKERLAAEAFKTLVTRNHTINTTFVTNEGFIFVAYLHHPTDVALNSFVASRSGMVDVSMHPNFVGPFALLNLWGSIRMPPIGWFASPDPVGKGRTRKVLTGNIDVSNGTFFGDHLYAQTAESAASSVTGAAVWSSLQYPVTTATQCQKSVEGQGSSLYALANLGDLQVAFDGT